MRLSDQVSKVRLFDAMRSGTCSRTHEAWEADLYRARRRAMLIVAEAGILLLESKSLMFCFAFMVSDGLRTPVPLFCKTVNM